jgi:hypothetical protein
LILIMNTSQLLQTSETTHRKAQHHSQEGPKFQ